MVACSGSIECQIAYRYCLLNHGARAVRELVRAKVENRAPEVSIEPDGKPRAPIINIMDALKQSMQKQGQTKVRDAVSSGWARLRPKRHRLDPQHAPAQSIGAACTKILPQSGHRRDGGGVRLEAKHAAGLIAPEAEASNVYIRSLHSV
jgi:hypothetical protein